MGSCVGLQRWEVGGRVVFTAMKHHCSAAWTHVYVILVYVALFLPLLDP